MTEANKPLMPPTYMVWAILTTCFCCLPFGIVSIIKASSVSSLYAQGLYAEATRASQDAKKWATIAGITGLVVIVLYIIFLVGFSFFALNESID